MRRATLAILLAALMFSGVQALPAAAQGGATNAPFTPVAPALQLPIPTLPSFSALQVQDEGGNRSIDVPFIAEYIVAIYRYALGIIVTLAMVMIVVGGLRWVTAAGNASTIGEARETITRAVMGLVIAFGSYTILFLINPELVNFRNIRIDLVRVPGPQLPLGSDDPTGSAQGERGGCRASPPPSVFSRTRTGNLQLDRINIRGVAEGRCPGGMVYHPDIVNAFIAAQEETGIPAGFLMAQAQHESPRSWAQANRTGELPPLLWGRKCRGAGSDVWLTDACPVGTKGADAQAQLRDRCASLGCSLLETTEWCDVLEAGRARLPAMACFQKFSSFAEAAQQQGAFYRDTIGGRYCRSCGDVGSYTGSVLGFAERMSCVLPGAVHADQWDNCLAMIIRTNCLEDSRNTDMIRLAEAIGPRGSCASAGADPRDPAASPDPYDTGRFPADLR